MTEHVHSISASRGPTFRGPHGDRAPRRSSAAHRSAPVADLIGRVADTEVTVLLRGERGTGKALVARAIHEASPRRDRPFVKIDLRRAPPQLVEAELFGSERGACRRGRSPGGSNSRTTARCSWTTSASSPRRCSSGSAGAARSEFTRPGARDRRTRRRPRHRRPRSAISSGWSPTAASCEGLFVRLNVVCLTLPPLRQRRNELRELTAVLPQPVRAHYNKPRDPALQPTRCGCSRITPGRGNLQRARSRRQAHRHAQLRATAARNCCRTDGGDTTRGAETRQRRRPRPDAGDHRRARTARGPGSRAR